MNNIKQFFSYSKSNLICEVTYVNSHSQKLQQDFLQQVIKDLVLNSRKSHFHRASHRNVVKSVIAEYFDEFVKHGSILNYFIVLDFRNNSSFIKKNDYNIDIEFLQKNCLVKTRINIKLKFIQIDDTPSNFELTLI